MITQKNNAIILKTQKHGETSVIARVLMEHEGVYHGVIRHALSKKNRGIYQPGNVIAAEWSARLSEHIGHIKGELMAPYAAHIMQSPLALSAMSSACALLVATLPERHAYPTLYKASIALLEALQAGDEQEYLQQYVQFELLLLTETGFGLDLSHCAATGTTEDLLYVSPKSGRAVSREAGEPYKDKLLPLPALFLPSGCQREGDKEIADALTLTGYFLEHWLFAGLHRQTPLARARFLGMLDQ